MKSYGTTNQTETFLEVKMIFSQYLNTEYVTITIIYLLFMYFLKHCLRSLKDQFFLIDRFLPKNDHPMTVYVREGVEVDKNRSNERSVTLTNLVQSTTGRYRCEVSTERPMFATVFRFGDLPVVGKIFNTGWPSVDFSFQTKITC